MAARKLNMFEKMANSLGAIYRYHKGEFPRRWDIVQKVAKRELAPPTQADLPAIKKDFAALQKVIESGAYKQYTLR
ncbi:Protein ASG-2, partial [Aphelenchoides avenae]